MNTMECIKSRRSVREFTNQQVSHSIMNQIIEAASFSPSWKNTQISRYVVVENENIKQNVMEHVNDHNRAIIAGAKTLVIVTFIKNRSGFERDGSYTTKRKNEWQMFDVGLACQTFSLTAHELGVSSVILGIFDHEEIAKEINLSEDREVAALIAIGYETEHPNAPKRKPVEELVEYI